MGMSKFWRNLKSADLTVKKVITYTAIFSIIAVFAAVTIVWVGAFLLKKWSLYEEGYNMGKLDYEHALEGLRLCNHPEFEHVHHHVDGCDGGYERIVQMGPVQGPRARARKHVKDNTFICGDEACADVVVNFITLPVVGLVAVIVFTLAFTTWLVGLNPRSPAFSPWASHTIDMRDQDMKAAGVYYWMPHYGAKEKKLE
jgi:hypothetical protein